MRPQPARAAADISYAPGAFRVRMDPLRRPHLRCKPSRHIYPFNLRQPEPPAPRPPDPPVVRRVEPNKGRQRPGARGEIQDREPR